MEAKASLSGEERALAGRIGFPEPVLLEAKSHALALGQLERESEDGLKREPVRGLVVQVATDRAEEALRSLREKLTPQGYFVFRIGHRPTPTLAVLETTDPFDAIRVMRPRDDEMDPEVVLERLLDWNRRYGLSIEGASPRHFEFILRQRPADFPAFAREVSELGALPGDEVGSLEEFVELLGRSNHIYLYWD